MSDIISVETFQHLVGLAALQLDETESEYLRRQLNNQLKAINELAAIPLDESAAITAHGVPFTAEISAPPRPDSWQAYPDPAGILAQAPQVEDGYIIVPDIPHTTLR
ncbi:MAG TPA: aspartyl/glutamyl-tRNA amidotransferase subunit C [Anaerolineaceae bacterium]